MRYPFKIHIQKGGNSIDPIRERFKNILRERGLSVLKYLRILHRDYDSTLSRAHFYGLLNHPEKIKVEYIKMFADSLDLDKEQQQQIFFKS